jgi:hypothetical protein
MKSSTVVIVEQESLASELEASGTLTHANRSSKMAG